MTDQFLIPPQDLADDDIFGFGVDALTGERKASFAFAKISSKSVVNSEAMGDTTYRSLVSDTSSYQEMLSNVASMSASGLSWSASASVGFAREQAASDTAVTLVWDRVIRSQDRLLTISECSLSADAIAKLKGGNGVADFIAAYGTHCMLGIAYGGSFTGAAQIETKSTSDKQKLSASISGSLTAFGASGSINDNFSSAVSSANVWHSESQSAKVIGADPISYSGMDLAAMTSAVEAFTITADKSLGVDGVPVAIICVSWSEFDDVNTALNGDPSALDMSRYDGTLLALGAEYSALAYAAGTSASLQSSDQIVPAYRSSLTRIEATASTAQDKIAGLGMTDLQAATADGIGPYVASPSLLAPLAIIGAGQVQVKTWYQLDWAFGSPNVTTVHTVAQDAGEAQLCDYNHVRSQGGGDPQHMTLYWTCATTNNEPSISVRMHWRDPYGPPGDADYVGPVVPLTGDGELESSVSWSMFPDSNAMSASLVRPY